VRRGGLWAKHRGSKQGTIGNTLGTHWELKEHIGNKGKMKKMLEESAESSDWVGRKLRSSHPRTNHELTTNKPYTQDVYTLLGCHPKLSLRLSDSCTSSKK